MHQRIVMGAQGQANVERHGAIGTKQRPVAAAGHHLAAQPWAFEGSAGRAEQDASAERAVTDGQFRIEVDAMICEVALLLPGAENPKKLRARGIRS